MKQALRLAARQQLQLTPHLKQAIYFLQLSTQELNQEIQMLMASNSFLENNEELDDDEGGGEGESEFAPQKVTLAENNEEVVAAEVTTVDFSWDDKSNFSTNNLSEDAHSALLEKYSAPTAILHEHLQWQLRIANLTELENAIGEVIIDAINDNGFIMMGDTDLQAGVKALGFSDVDIHDIQRMISFIQSFDPVGVGARNLLEALLFQLQMLSPSLPGYALAKQLISNELTALANHQYSSLQRRYHVDNEQFENALKLIHKLNPRPGNMSRTVNIAQQIVPDVIVNKAGQQQWVVMLKRDVLPNIRLNSDYLHWLETSSYGDSRCLVQQHLQEARWLIKCLHNRNETLLKVARCIIKYQTGFLQYGPGAMKPLVLRDIANELTMHPSTISRVTSNKYIQTPQGTYELKYFFSSQVKTSYGSACSSKAICSYIQQMIKQEKTTQPLSDEQLAQQLLKQGIQIARRTVTKYREN